MNKQKAKEIRDKVTPLLEALAKELNCSVYLGVGRFDTSDIRFKLEFTDLTANGQAITKEELDFKALAGNYGLAPSDLGRGFYSQGYNFTIIGLKTNRPKLPIQCRREDGRQFKFPALLVKELLPPVPNVLVTFLKTA